MSDKVISSTTQEFLDVYDIVNDMVLLKDGTVSMILQVGTMNFSLLAEQEQDAIIFTYGSLLNSLNYPIQISIQSQTKDVTKYLRLLDEQIAKSSTDRKATLIKKYRDFVAALIKERNVLQKNFFVTIPASPAEMGLFTATSVLPGKTAFDINTVEKSIILEKAINLLAPRRDHLTSQFGRLGLYVRQLNTQEIIQNFYINYNPEAAEGQEISSNENYTTPLVRASFGRKIMQTNIDAVQVQPLPIDPTDNSRPPESATPAEPILENPVAENLVQAAQTQSVQETPTPTPAAESTIKTFTPEEILSGNAPAETPMEEPIVQTSEFQETPIAPIAAPIVAPEPTSAPEPVIEQVVAPEPVMTPESILTPEPAKTPDLNLSLDPSLINASPTAETNYQEPVLETTPEVEIAQEAAVAPETAAVQETNDFAEEIKPIQNRFETIEPAVETPQVIEPAPIEPTEPEETQI